MGSLQGPFPILLLDINGPLLVQADTARVQDRRRENGIGDRRQTTMCVVIGRLARMRIHAAHGVNKFLDRDIAITPLTVKMTALIRRVLHVKRVEAIYRLRTEDELRERLSLLRFTLPVYHHLVPPVGLVKRDLTLARESPVT